MLSPFNSLGILAWVVCVMRCVDCEWGNVIWPSVVYNGCKLKVGDMLRRRTEIRPVPCFQAATMPWQPGSLSCNQLLWHSYGLIISLIPLHLSATDYRAKHLIWNSRLIQLYTVVIAHFMQPCTFTGEEAKTCCHNSFILFILKYPDTSNMVSLP